MLPVVVPHNGWQMNMMPDWRSEMEQAKKELGSPGVLAVYWLVTAVLLFALAVLVGGMPWNSVSVVFNILVILIAAAPIALGLGWLTARNKK